VKQPHYSKFVSAGHLGFFSGILALDPDGVIRSEGIEAQTRRVLDSLNSLLHSHALTKNNIVKTTVWLRNAPDFWNFDAEYARFFGAHAPARSTVVSNLVLDDALIELEAIALLHGAAQ